MQFLRARRCFVAWLAALAMAMGALVPALAQAAAASTDDARWVELCTATGMVWVQAGADPDAAGAASPAPGGGQVSSSSCPWCLLHGGAAGLPPVLDAIALPERLAGLPPAFYRAPLLSMVWAPRHARAPPALA